MQIIYVEPVINKVTTGNANSNRNQAGQTGVTNGNTPSDNTTSNTPLPNTGYRVILIPVIALAIVGIVFYKKYSKYNNI